MGQNDNPYANFLDKLSPESKKWFAIAITGSITSDGVVDDVELGFLRVAISFLEDASEIEDLVFMAKERTVPKLTQLRLKDRVVAFKVFLAVAKIVTADNVITASEKEYIQLVGGKLGFKKEIIKKVLAWLDLSIGLNISKQHIKEKEQGLNQELTQLLKTVVSSNVEYS